MLIWRPSKNTNACDAEEQGGEWLFYRNRTIDSFPQFASETPRSEPDASSQELDDKAIPRLGPDPSSSSSDLRHHSLNHLCSKKFTRYGPFVKVNYDSVKDFGE